MSDFDVTVDAGALRNALASGIYGRAGDPPVFRHALLRLENGLQVTSTDSQVERTDRIEATGQGEAILPEAQKMRGALTGIEGHVRLHSKGGDLVMTSGRRRFAVPVLPPRDFPEADIEGNAAPVECDGAALAEALNAVQYAAGTSGKVGTVTEGILVEAGNVFATDGVRLSHTEVDVKLPEGIQLVLPKPTIKPLAALLADDAALSLVRDGSGAAASVVADTGTSRLVVRLIGQRYPNWRRVLQVQRDDQECLAEVTFRAGQELRNVLARVKPFCGSNLPILTFTSDDGTLSVKPMEGAAAEDSVAADIEGKVDVSMNADFVDAVLGKAGADTVLTWRCFGAPGFQEWKIDGKADLHGMMSFRR